MYCFNKHFMYTVVCYIYKPNNILFKYSLRFCSIDVFKLQNIASGLLVKIDNFALMKMFTFS